MHFKGANVNFLSFTLSINFNLVRCENFRELKPNKKDEEEEEDRESVVIVGPETMLLLFLRNQKQKNVSSKINVRESEKSERERERELVKNRIIKKASKWEGDPQSAHRLFSESKSLCCVVLGVVVVEVSVEYLVIYIYIERERERERVGLGRLAQPAAAATNQ